MNAIVTVDRFFLQGKCHFKRGFDASDLGDGRFAPAALVIGGGEKFSVGSLQGNNSQHPK